MARIAGVDLPKNKRLEIALRYIYGIGPKRSLDVIKALSLNADIRTEQLTEAQIAQLTSYIQGTYVVEGELRRNSKRLRWCITA